MLTVGGVTFDVVSNSPAIVPWLDDPSSLFSGGGGADIVRFDVDRKDLSALEAGEAVFDSGGSWALHRESIGWRFDFFAPLLGSAPYRVAWMDRDFSAGRVVIDGRYLRDETRVDPIHFPLAELVAIQRLARSGGVEFHACGIVDRRGRGALFVGQSGHGKTTTAKLWASREDVTILSDDRIIVRTSPTAAAVPPLQMERDGARIGGEVRMYGTPWHGDGMFAANLTAVPRAIFLLEHGSENEVVPISGAAAIAALFARCFPPFWDAESVEAVLATIERVVESVPCFWLRFLPDQSAVSTVERVLGEIGE